jgi:transcriptional regulator with PAS, ATPase and Fis domain
MTGTTRDFLIHILGNLSDAAAIVNQDGVILHANIFFKTRFTLTGFAKNLSSGLRIPDPCLKSDREKSPLQRLFLPGKDALCAMNVYLIDAPEKGDHHYLLLPGPVMETGADQVLEQTTSIGSRMDDKKNRAEIPDPEFRELVGEDPSFRRALLIAQRAAKADLPVLIIGESGTGKEIVAQAIHRTSRRSNKPLVDVNCAAIPDALIESELFGYEKGAFTGARTEGRTGYFEAAHGGTMLMDEIGDASLQVQSKLLRVLEEGCFKRMGGNRNVKVDVRIISSTNKDLGKNIVEKTFREDLYYRLNTFSIHLPPLRDRAGDISLLVDHFLAANVNSGHLRYRFLPSCMEILRSYHWPGNVRELKGVVNYAVNMSSRAAIDPSALPSFLHPRTDLPGEAKGGPDAGVSVSRRDSHMIKIIRDVEKDIIKDALEKSANRSEAIKRLGISRRTFYIKLKQYGLS